MSFSSHGGDIASRTISVKGAGLAELMGGAGYSVARVHGADALCDLFEYEVTLRTPDAYNPVPGPLGNLDKQALEGRELTIEIELDTGNGVRKREVTGVVTRVSGPVLEGRHYAYGLVLRPWLWLATCTSDYRIFQDKNVIEILEELLADYNFPMDKRLSPGGYPRRTFQVQYGETDFAFFQRLTQEWGIAWYFEHANGHHRLVLADDNGGYKRFPNSTYQTLDWREPIDAENRGGESLHAFAVVDQLVPGRWRGNDHDFSRPGADLTVRAEAPRETNHRNQEIYEWPAGHVQPATDNDPLEEGALIARIRMEELRQHGRRAQGRGSLRGLVPGCTFALTRHPEAAANTDYLICATTLTLTEVAEASGQPGGWHCAVNFEAQPVAETYRPARTQPQPRTTGPQTATVAGPAGHDVWTDQFGRVRIQFHWDMAGKRDEHSSCWVRVASPWHGEEYGAVHTPRIGQEVIVDFLHGDPDLPIIIGCVPNRSNMPPWRLPGQQALSGFRSKEIGGERLNQLVMDDTQGEIQAQLSCGYLLSQLNLGRITRIPDAGGRQDQRGEGAELRTDGHMLLRSGHGTLLSSEARCDAGGHAVDMREAIARLQQALELANALQEVSVNAQAQTDEQRSVAESIARQNDEIRGDGSEQGGLSAPHIVLSSAAGIAATSEESTHLHSGRHTSLTTAGHLSFNVGRRWVASATELVSICAHKLGVRLIASRGPVEIQAQNDSLSLLSRLGLSIVSTEDSIRIQANKELLIGAAGSFTRYDASGITHLTDGTYTAHASMHAWPGKKSLSLPLPKTLQDA